MPPHVIWLPECHLLLLLAQSIEKQLTDTSGCSLDAYEVESTHERSDVLADLAEFQLAAVRLGWTRALDAVLILIQLQT
jgi:hypothetical protein